jgi:hypothetical protein
MNQHMYWDSDEQELVGQILFLVRNKICYITKSQQQPAAIHLENSYFIIRINTVLIIKYYEHTHVTHVICHYLMLPAFFGYVLCFL